MDRKWSCPILIKIRQKRTEITAVQSKKMVEKGQKIAKSSKAKKTQKTKQLVRPTRSDMIFVKATPFV